MLLVGLSTLGQNEIESKPGSFAAFATATCVGMPATSATVAQTEFGWRGQQGRTHTGEWRQ